MHPEGPRLPGGGSAAVVRRTQVQLALHGQMSGGSWELAALARRVSHGLKAAAVPGVIGLTGPRRHPTAIPR